MCAGTIGLLSFRDGGANEAFAAVEAPLAEGSDPIGQEADAPVLLEAVASLLPDDVYLGGAAVGIVPIHAEASLFLRDGRLGELGADPVRKALAAHGADPLGRLVPALDVPWFRSSRKAALCAFSEANAAAAVSTESAWRRFFASYAGPVFAFARSRGLQETDADDVVQTVFAELAAPGGFSGYDAARGAFWPWLARRAAWRAADLRRGEKARLSLERSVFANRDVPAVSIPTFDDEPSETIHDEVLRRLRADVPPERFAVFSESILDGLSTENVCAKHGITRGNLYQIRRRLRVAYLRQWRALLDERNRPKT